MNPTAQIIGIKQFHKDMKKISELVAEGQEFIVVKNSKPAFKIVPVNPLKSLFTLKDLSKLQFNTGQKNLSKEIDKILYGTDS